jgi:hypothetical protein
MEMGALARWFHFDTRTPHTSAILLEGSLVDLKFERIKHDLESGLTNDNDDALLAVESKPLQVRFEPKLIALRGNRSREPILKSFVSVKRRFLVKHFFHRKLWYRRRATAETGLVDN